MTITSEERELLDMLHKAMPERKNLMLITNCRFLALYR